MRRNIYTRIVSYLDTTAHSFVVEGGQKAWSRMKKSTDQMRWNERSLLQSYQTDERNMLKQLVFGNYPETILEAPWRGRGGGGGGLLPIMIGTKIR